MSFFSLQCGLNRFSLRTDYNNEFVMDEKDEMKDPKSMESAELEVDVKGEEPENDPKNDEERGEKGEGHGNGAKPIDYKMRFTKRGRDRWVGEYDDDLDDDRFSEMMNRIADYDDERDEKFNRLVEGNRKLYDIFAKDPETFQVFEKLKDGVPLPIALREVYKDEDYLTMDEDSDAYKRFKAERDEESRRKEERDRNLAEFENSRSDFYKEAGMSDDDISKFEEAEQAFYEGMLNGKFDKDYFKRIDRALHYDDDVKAGYEQGKADGKNEKIHEYVRRTVGDGLPDPDGAGGGLNEKRKEELSPAAAMFRDIADKAKESKWNK